MRLTAEQYFLNDFDSLERSLYKPHATKPAEH